MDDLQFSNPDPGLIGIASRVYAVLLFAYPSRFRSQFAAQMCQVFRDSCLRAYRNGGRAGLLALWARTMLDYLSSVVEENIDRGIDMNKSKFIKLSGWAMILGAISLTVGAFATNRPAYDVNNARSVPLDRFLVPAADFLLLAAVSLLVVGAAGLVARFMWPANPVGKAGLGLSLVSGIASLVGIFGLRFISDSGPWWTLFSLGLILYILGLALFGIACLRQRLLPRWNGLALATCIWTPLLLPVFFLGPGLSGEVSETVNTLGIYSILIALLGMALLGFLMQSTPSEESQTASA